jgi:Flp pilus assembly protein TadG
MLRDRRGGTMAEAAVSIPALLMILVLALNASQAGLAALAARNAANYAARIASVAGMNAKAYAEAAAKASYVQAGAPGDFTVEAEVIGEGTGSVVSVTVGWSTPTLLAGICPIFGEGCPAVFSGQARAVWRREGLRW